MTVPVLALVALALGGSLASTSQELEDAEEELAASNELVSEGSDAVDDLRAQAEDAQAQAEEELAQAQADAADEIAGVRADLADRRARIEERESELDEREEAITAFETAVENNSFGDGTYLIGEEVQPGRYRNDGSGGFCYWERLSGLSGSFNEIIANGSPNIVDIAATDEAFHTEGCGTWQKIG
jgi:multidrug efflux pump subunit AcrA (membrane-fusion protein)